MDELRANNKLQIEMIDGSRIEGIVAQYSKDRVLVKISDNTIEAANRLNELDDLSVQVQTIFGLKTMVSCVISKLFNGCYIVIENSKVVDEFCQQRQFVRIVDNFEFAIKVNSKLYNVKCDNISGNGVAFFYDKIHLEEGETIDLIFPGNIYGKMITCSATIIKVINNVCAVAYNDINEYDQCKIVKRIFALMTKK